MCSIEASRFLRPVLGEIETKPISVGCTGPIFFLFLICKASERVKMMFVFRNNKVEGFEMAKGTARDGGGVGRNRGENNFQEILYRSPRHVTSLFLLYNF